MGTGLGPGRESIRLSIDRKILQERGEIIQTYIYCSIEVDKGIISIKKVKT